MKIHIPNFEQARVLVVGDLMLDRYWYGSTSRISPEAPVPVVHVGESEERPGGAGNVALNIASLGGHSDLIGLVGADEAAAALARRLEGAGVRCHFETAPGMPTVTKLRVISRHQQLIRLDFEDGFHAIDTGVMQQRYQALLAQCDAVILSDYGKGTLNAVQALITAARAAGKPVLIDPKGQDYTIYRGATLITPNSTEFEAVVGPCKNDEELVSKGEQLREALQLDALLVTRSEKGMTLLRKGQPALHLPTKAQEVYDVTGAGDTVIATLAAALAAGVEIAEATALANLAAGVVVGKLGTATATVAELRRAIREHDQIEGGVMTEERLETLVRDAQSHGERVVMTNGCFDILHAGHVTYLEQARKLGDRLIVAVNDDASVKRLKGEARPVNSLAQRMTVLAALGSVDWVVPFTEDTPERLICHIKPNVLVKGGDYRPDQIAGGQCVTEAGGEVVVLGFVDGVSTTRIINLIRGS
ncbi:MAG: bifunctional D-glycero-beta-D-manno-heptose-7-phosphate kinase/D-glycero-beta-D-manno-heptose 1-phosphate adenylyltransferase HldE [Pseudomonadota bacterium]|nr:bifunctional D-glycero-beta-D-manno-heptose-7-phosphate kinase/D-glycero-beta-D-manno-heptose 1-phosphate adenylyltransferase HldE [Pseudomonadota bacterium]